MNLPVFGEVRPESLNVIGVCDILRGIADWVEINARVVSHIRVELQVRVTPDQMKFARMRNSYSQGRK